MVTAAPPPCAFSSVNLPRAPVKLLQTRSRVRQANSLLIGIAFQCGIALPGQPRPIILDSNFEGFVHPPSTDGHSPCRAACSDPMTNGVLHDRLQANWGTAAS